jgi:hypothetical protein
VEAVVDGLPGAIALGEVTSRSAGVEVPEDAVDHTAMGPPGMPRMVVVVAIRKEGSDTLPLGIGEFVAVHA